MTMLNITGYLAKVGTDGVTYFRRDVLEISFTPGTTLSFEYTGSNPTDTEGRLIGLNGILQSDGLAGTGPGVVDARTTYEALTWAGGTFDVLQVFRTLDDGVIEHHVFVMGGTPPPEFFDGDRLTADQYDAFLNTDFAAQRVQNGLLLPDPAAPEDIAAMGRDYRITRDDLVEGTPENDVFLGGRGEDTITGGAGDDLIDGGAEADRLIGDGIGEVGNDTLLGRDGRDLLFLEAGDDVGIGGEGNDIINGGMGNDSLVGGTGDDWLTGGSGNNGNDTMRGGDGNDYLSDFAGYDLLSGGSGNDRIVARGGRDNIFGDRGDDSIDAGAGSVDAGTGDDTVTIRSADFDMVRGGSGRDLLEISDRAIQSWVVDLRAGTAEYEDDTGNTGTIPIPGFEDLEMGFTFLNGTHVLSGTQAANLIVGGGRADAMLMGRGGDDTIRSGGESTIFGGSGDDDITGSFRDDLIRGGRGDDVMNGGSGIDAIFGGVGDDTLAGARKTSMIGGAGSDTFVFTDGNAKTKSVVRDWNHKGDQDRIDLRDARGIDDATDLFDTHLTQTDRGLLITSDRGATLLLRDMTLADVETGDFLF
ncbi:MAG: calcium-binding protein [Pseudomonadota bacterium]